MKRLTTIMCAVALLGTARVWATPVDVPASALDMMQETTMATQTLAEEVPLEFWIAPEADWVTDRDLDIGSSGTGADAEATFYGGKIGFSVMDQVDVYWGLFQSQDVEFNFRSPAGAQVEFDLDDELFWEAGVNVDLLEVPIEDFGEMTLFVDVDYRTNLDDLGFENVTVGSSVYSGAQLSDISEVEWKEWQAALGASFRMFDMFVPYAGVMYSDVEMSGRAQAGGTTYALNDAESDDVVGVFVGTSIAAGETFALDLQARFVDETAYTVTGTFKF